MEHTPIPPRRLPPDARIIRPGDQPQRYDLIAPAARPAARPIARPQRSLLRDGLTEMIGTILPAVMLALLIHLFLAQATRVEGYSMEPTLYGQQRLIVEKLTYRLRPPARGEIVVIHVPGYGDEMLIKRVIGLPGEQVEVRDGQVFVDGQALREPYLAGLTYGDYPATQVPEQHVFVMGDNRNNSNDSRAFGPIASAEIVGRAWLRYWPPQAFGRVR